MLFCTVDFIYAIPITIALLYLFVVVCRWFIFRKMNLRPWLSLIPIVREYKIYKRCWNVWPFLLLIVLAVVFGMFVQISGYIGFDSHIPPYIKSNIGVLSIVCLMALTVLMYKRLAFAFGRDIGYMMGLLFLNPIFMGMLAFSKKNTYHEEAVVLRGSDLKEYLKTHRNLRNRILSAVSAIVIAACSVGYISNLVMKEQQPGFLVRDKLGDYYELTSSKVSGKGKVIYPALEEGTVSDDSVRPLYYPDKSAVSETTVYMYLIGSDLEDATGAASINLAQIRDATAAGENLTFIIEAGGSGRWFTDGFKNRATARYMIRNGEVTLLETLPANTCMTKPETLERFLKWANRTYPADRTMLFFWDHGGGIAGFGSDILNPRQGQTMLSIGDITGALAVSGAKYDVIGFDACLMQSMEVGQCMEPYADYLLASEEAEPGDGMYYTEAFSRLAKEPDLSTLKFGAMMCSSFDQSHALTRDTPSPGYTLSMTELRYMPVVEETFIGYLSSLDREFRKDRNSFINMSAARSKAYEFMMEDQIDLIDFINLSGISAYEKNAMISKIKKAIVCRNAASANHINGLAVYMPYDNLYSYSGIYSAMKELGLNEETKVYNDFASIIASQKTSKGEPEDYSLLRDEDWYVKGFEHYDIDLYKQDIPLIKKGGEYEIQLTDEEWQTITNYEQGLKLKVGNRYADLGSDNVFDLDSEGHYMLEFNDTWVAINGVLVALHPGTPQDMGGGKIVYSGTVDATLNFTTPITIYIEWIDIGDQEGEGKVLGYLPADQDSDDVDEAGMPRGYKQFKSSNIVTFLYDWYDEDGNYITTALGHLPINVGTYGLRVTQKDISSEEYYYYGMLQDVMHRTIQTETLHHKPEK